MEKVSTLDYKSVEEDRGWYKIWVTENTVIHILSILGFDYSDFKDSIEISDNLCCIYVGESDNLQKRFKNHFSEKSSSFSRHIKAILQNDNTPFSNEVLSNWLSECYVEYGLAKDLDKSLAEHEAYLINSHLRILNHESNEHPKAKPIIGKIKQLN